MSSIKNGCDPPGEVLTLRLGAYQTEALRDFCATFGISLEHGARIILSEYLERAGYYVEVVPYTESERQERQENAQVR